MSVYLITGASRGIGFELCKQLVARGDVVIAAARTPEKATNLKELEGSQPGKLHLVKLDVEDASTIKVWPSRAHARIRERSAFDIDASFKSLTVAILQAAAATLEKQFPGGLDVLINNAGISGSFLQASQE